MQIHYHITARFHTFGNWLLFYDGAPLNVYGQCTWTLGNPSVTKHIKYYLYVVKVLQVTTKPCEFLLPLIKKHSTCFSIHTNHTNIRIENRFRFRGCFSVSEQLYHSWAGNLLNLNFLSLKPYRASDFGFQAHSPHSHFTPWQIYSLAVNQQNP